MRVITGTAKGKRLITPEGRDVTRPTGEKVKEGIFSSIQFLIEGADVLDLFAGSGQLGIEALSRGAKSAVFVDSAKVAQKCITENIKNCGFSDVAKLKTGDALMYLSSAFERFDIAFLDPPYAEVFLENSLKMITEIDILQSGGIIVTERPVGKELPWNFEGFERSRDYKYGNTLLTIYRKTEKGETAL